MKKLVYICSACRGDYENNLHNAQLYCRAIIKTLPDVVPIAPHLLFTQFLNDEDPWERSLGLAAGIALLDICDEMWVFGLDKPSKGMKAEIEYAKEYGIPVRDGFKVCKNLELPEEEELGDVLLTIPTPSPAVKGKKAGEIESTTVRIYGDVVVELAKALRKNRGADISVEVG